MDAVKHDLTIDLGRDFREYFGFRNDDDSAIDLSTYTVKAQIRAAASIGAPLIADFTVDTTAEAAGDIYLQLNDAETAAITDTRGYYDILITDASGSDETWVYGSVTFQGRPTTNA